MRGRERLEDVVEGGGKRMDLGGLVERVNW